MHKNILSGVLLMLIGIGIGIYFLAIDFPKKSAVLGAEGKNATGIIQNLRTERGRRSTSYVADISFKDDKGLGHSVESKYDHSYWTSLRIGQKVTVRYHKSDPEYGFDIVSRNAKPPDFLLMTAISGGMFLIGVALLVFGILRRK